MYASARGHMEAAKQLLEAGLDPNVMEVSHTTALHYATWGYWESTIISKRLIGFRVGSDRGFQTLGHCLFHLNEIGDAFVGLEQGILGFERGTLLRKDIRHAVTCSSCSSNPIMGKRFVCTLCAEMYLCPSCMDKYKDGAAVRGCSGHEFLEVPRPSWINFAPESVNEEGETLD